MEVKIKSIGGAMPSYETEGAAGADVRAFIDAPIVLNPGERALIGTGLFFAIPSGYEIQVRPRSGLAAKNGVTVYTEDDIKKGALNKAAPTYNKQDNSGAPLELSLLQNFINCK